MEVGYGDELATSECATDWQGEGRGGPYARGGGVRLLAQGANEGLSSVQDEWGRSEFVRGEQVSFSFFVFFPCGAGGRLKAQVWFW